MTSIAGRSWRSSAMMPSYPGSLDAAGAAGVCPAPTWSRMNCSTRFKIGWAGRLVASAEAQTLAAAISGCWAAFAKGDEPECGGVEWPEVDDGRLLDFTNDGPQVRTDDPWEARLDLVESIVARVGEGTVHRLWEPLAEKQRPSTPYSAKFSGPFALALGLTDRAAGLEQFAPARARDPTVCGRRAAVFYVLDHVAAHVAAGPVLVHCAYGKDRAGLATALVQSAIGVPAGE